jgi:nucleotidyltransferase/DNA polymerase involved in DNA repair
VDEQAVTAAEGFPEPSASTRGKACLNRYRKASAEVFAIFNERFPQAVLEKASIDEAYLGVPGGSVLEHEHPIASMLLPHLHTRYLTACLHEHTCLRPGLFVRIAATDSSEFGHTHLMQACNGLRCTIDVQPAFAGDATISMLQT